MKIKLVSLLTAAAITQTFAQDVEQIVIVGVVPAGASQELDKIPYPIQTSSAENLRNIAALSLADFLAQSFSSISLNDVQSNPMQPDLQYRGFTASPLLGPAQGITVHQNGVRINEPLGDTVNWDLLPQSAIQRITLNGGANPLFGLNSLGGSLIIDMKDGFNFQEPNIKVSSGSFDRTTANIEIGGNNGQLGYYLNIDSFEEDGWRDHSNSDAINFYGSVGWRSDYTQLNLNYQHGDSELTGNGSSPIELLNMDRKAIFTGPDITNNSMTMISGDFAHEVNSTIRFNGNISYRKNKTNSFNGDGSEFSVCKLGNELILLEGLEEDKIEGLGLDGQDICENQYANLNELENFLNITAAMLSEEGKFKLDGFDSDNVSGTGILSDEAINNISDRNQESTGADLQWTFSNKFFGYNSQLVIGGAYFNGESYFNSVVELANIDSITRLTTGLGTGAFIDEESTFINTETESFSIYFTNSLDISSSVTLTLSARGNKTTVDLRDKSGDRPELNGSHSFARINPAIGITFQATDAHNLYASYSESSRAPTPIELACNEGVFDLAVQYALEDGEDPDDVEFECRLPNAFLADPPLKRVVAKSFELGSRGFLGDVSYSFGFFHTTNHDDILFQTTGRSTGLFANIDKTLRSGIESQLAGKWQNLSWKVAYSRINATFEDSFNVLSPNHAFADGEGEITVESGDYIPGIPQNQFKTVIDYQLSEGFNIGLDLVNNDKQFLRGDESNQLDQIDGYHVVNVRARYQLNDNLQIFAAVHNVFDEEYETFGLLGEDPGEVEVPVIEDFKVPLFFGAAPPRSGFLGIKYSF